MEKVRVVILGCGYAGTCMASLLAKYSELELVMVEKREFFAHKIGGLRVLIPIDGFAPKARIVFGIVEGVDVGGEKVVVVKKDESSEAERIPYDILICATGARNNGPADLPANVRTAEQARQFYAAIRDAIHRSSKILIIGGGPVSLELAGEIRDAYSHDSVGRKEQPKEIVIATAATELLSSNIQPNSKAFFSALGKRLQESQIQISLNSHVTQPNTREFNLPILEGKQTVTFSSGAKRECDLLILCAGWRLQSSMYPEAWVTPSGELTTSLSLHVADRFDVFALGDITSLLQTKLGFNPSAQGPFLERNLMKAAKEILKMRAAGESTKDLAALNARLGSLKYENAVLDKTTSMLISLGPRIGVSEYAGYVLGSFSTRMFKGSGLYSDYFFSLAKKHAPKAVIRKIDFVHPPPATLAVAGASVKKEDDQIPNQASP